MMSIDGVNFDNHKEASAPRLLDILQSGSDMPRADVIDYLRDVNVAVQDILNLFKDTFKNIARSLSRKPNLFSFQQNPDPENVDRVFSTEETREIGPPESGNETDCEISKAAYDFLTKFKFLVEYTEKRIYLSPTEQQDHDRKLRHAIRSSRKTDTDIKFLNEALAIQRMEHKKSVDKLYEELNECQKSSNQRQREIKNDIRRIVNESELKMINFYNESVEKQEILHSEIKILETRVNNLRRTNILLEKELRDKRCRVETQLLDFVTKYDSDIGGLHRDMENFAREFELLDSQRKMLEENVMLNLRTLHDDLQDEKAAALQKILNERVERFVRNRAARIIQKAWKAYWERHCAKKKKKSRKK